MNIPDGFHKLGKGDCNLCKHFQGTITNFNNDLLKVEVDFHQSTKN